MLQKFEVSAARLPFRAEARVRRADGEWRWLDSYAVPRSTELGRTPGMIGCSADITERKQAEDAMGQLRHRRRSSDDAIVSKDLNGVIMSWNKGAERLFGYAAEEVIGKSAMILIPPDRADEETRFWKASGAAKRLTITKPCGGAKTALCRNLIDGFTASGQSGQSHRRVEDRPRYYRTQTD